MCGIISIISENNIMNKTLEGLKKLEYRGYDSSGMSIISNNNIKTLKKEGKIANLEKIIKKNKNFDANIAISHTRWSTHGQPNEKNSHPHSSDNISVVHNGIIENHQEIRGKLIKSGIKFLSETDSEVIPHLISLHLKKTSNIKQAIFETISEIKGSFALAIISKDNPDLIIGAKRGSPLIIGYGKQENYLASDYFALEDFTNKISYLEDGDVAFVTKEKIEIFNSEAKLIKRDIEIIENKAEKITKENYEHFMLKEIFEQPKVVQDSINQYLDIKNNKINLPNFPFDLAKFKEITIIACGTSYYAAMAAKNLIESLARITVNIDIASEFRYRDVIFKKDNLMIFISQSGETADTIAALKFAKENKQTILSIVNVEQSTMSHLSDAIIRTVAGVEIGVASTKAFTAQLIILAFLAIKIAIINKNITQARKKELIQSFIPISSYIEQILSKDSIKNIKSIAKSLNKAENILYIGRGISYSVALEGALKLKELTYVPASGIASGELKHGTIALIDKNTAIIAITPSNKLFEKSASNIAEIAARNGKIILISDQKGINHLQNTIHKSITLPKSDDIISELLLSAIPTQLIAYYCALYKGHDVDQPRNLAKSVTVE